MLSISLLLTLLVVALFRLEVMNSGFHWFTNIPHFCARGIPAGYVAFLVLANLCGCASHPPAPVPSTAAVRASVQSARASNAEATQHVTAAQTLQQRIDAKDRVIDEWERKHHPTP